MEIFDRLEDTERRYEELQAELNEPTVANDTTILERLLRHFENISRQSRI